MSSYFHSIALLTQKWAQYRKLRYCFLLKTESTNEDAKKEITDFQTFSSSDFDSLGSSFFRKLCFKDLSSDLNFKLYVAQHQTSGRGRNRKLWKDQGGGGELLSSWAYIIDFCPQHLSSLFAGVALYKSVKKIWPNLHWSLKPPNDLFLGGKKIGGLLLENFSLSLEPLDLAVHETCETEDKMKDTRELKRRNQKFCLIIGLGFNFFSFPGDEKKATCMKREDFSVKKYFYFLDHLFFEFFRVSRNSSRIFLKGQERILLQKALRAYPHKKYLKITEEGNLLTKEGEISWKSL